MLAPRSRVFLFLMALTITFVVGAWWDARPHQKPVPITPVVDAAAAGPTMLEDAADGAPLPGKLLVLAREDAVVRLEADLHQAVPSEHVNVGQWSHMNDMVMVRVDVPPGTELAATEVLKQEPGVESVEPDSLMQAYGAPAREPNDPLYQYLWNMRKVGAVGAWRGSTGKGVVVAVIDTGVAYEAYKNFHKVEDMEATRFVTGFNALTGSEHANDDHCHGTHVAATIAEDTNNNKGAIGLAFDARIMPIKVLSANGAGSIGGIADGIRYAADHGANVINMSLGGPIGANALRTAVSYAYRKGVVVVCAAGNSSSTSVGYPASYPECIAVSAIRDDNTLSWYSNRGKRIDIAAPGGDTQVDQNNDGYMDGILQNTIERNDPTKEGYFLFQGTSMASPHVAAAAALVEALGITNPVAVKAILQQAAYRKDLDLEKGYGAGILDADKAVKQAIMGTGAAQLLLAMVLLAMTLRLAKGGDYTRLTPFTLVGIVAASSGLFFLPYVTNGEIPAADFLCRPIPAWDIQLLGLGSHANPFFYSALFPMALSLLLNKKGAYLQQLLTGLSVGYGACILHLALSEQASVRWVPSFLHLQTLWLVVNAALCVFMAIGLADARKPQKRQNQLS